MTDLIRCPRCGGEFLAAETEDHQGACPRCLAALALEDTLQPSPPAGDDPPPLAAGATFRDLEIIELLGRGGGALFLCTCPAFADGEIISLASFYFKRRTLGPSSELWINLENDGIIGLISARH